MIKRKAKSKKYNKLIDMAAFKAAYRAIKSGDSGRKTVPTISDSTYAKFIRAVEKNKNLGAEVVMPLDGSGQTRLGSLNWITTGYAELDNLLGGGIPEGRIIELFGPESSGKSTLAILFGAAIQRAGYPVAYIDAENAVDKQYLKNLGIDLDKKMLFFSQPDSAEQGLEFVRELVKAKIVKLIIIDSIAALVPQRELDKTMGEMTMGIQANLLSTFFRKIASVTSKAGVTIVCINQLRQKIGIMFGNPETTPGGNALKFYSSIRIDVRRIGSFKDGQQAIGNNVKIKTVKNKVSEPFRMIEAAIVFGKGFTKFRKLRPSALRNEA
jgi:recombination protein RecA